jgi:hypothetical protein
LFGTETKQIVLLNVEGSIGMAIVQSLLCIDLLLTYPVVMRPSIGILEEHWLGLSRDATTNNKKNGSREDGEEEDGLQMVALVPSSAGSPAALPASDSCVNSSDASGSGNALFSSGEPRRRGMVGRGEHMAVCLALGVVAAGAGSFVPAFGLLSGLVGGVSQTFLAFVLPPLMWSKQQQQHEQREERGGEGEGEPTVWVCFRSLPWREKALVLCGMGLIGWTLQSTWAELGDGRN